MDLISRQATIRFIRDKVSLSLFMKRSVDKADKACMELCEMLDRELPSAEVVEVVRCKDCYRNGCQYESFVAERHEFINHGTWIKDEFGSKCSSCGLYAYQDKFGKPWESPYCPICGAKMDKEYAYVSGFNRIE